MTVDIEGAVLDLESTKFAEPSSITEVGDIRLQDVLIREGGFRDDDLDGRFYGPNHEEAGGVFERDGIAGAFSWERD